jgi:hypothetical protein
MIPELYFMRFYYDANIKVYKELFKISWSNITMFNSKFLHKNT